jgi:lipopolysaccharide biosynthesis glycosyltransferase
MGPSNSASVIVFGADEAYLAPLAVTLNSLSSTTGGRLPWRVVVLGIGLTSKAHEQLCVAGNPLPIEFVDVSPEFFSNMPRVAYFSDAALLRLIAPAIVPGRPDRLLYCDSDVLFCEPPEELMALDLGGHPVAASLDAALPRVSLPGALEGWKDLGLDPRTAYLNSGVLLMDGKRWRQDRIGERVLEFLKSGIRRVNYPDQDGLNTLLAGDFLRLPFRWNAQSPLRLGTHCAFPFVPPDEIEAAINEPAIIHFTGASKPWHRQYLDPRGSQWRDVLSRTPWCDYVTQNHSITARARRFLGRLIDR